MENVFLRRMVLSYMKLSIVQLLDREKRGNVKNPVNISKWK
ncbi:hypothetical protein US8_03437 [Bacillus altitudinis]|nr:hypothetical protein US8_03437 [Bacillus altitudinis]